MSRIGKHPIEIPAGVTVLIDNGFISGKGKNSEFKFKIPENVNVDIVDGKIIFKPCDDSKVSRSMWGTCRAIVAKQVKGLTEVFVKKLNLVGVGYKASIQGNSLVLQLGYSHDIIFEIPTDVKITCENPTTIVVSSANNQRVGEIIRNLQKFRPPEPYKGKGVIIDGQFVYRKEGKKR